MSKHTTRWWPIALLILSAVAMAGPNNYIGIDEDGKVYELNHGASSGSLNIDEGEHYETYSTSGTDIIYFDMATQAELDAIELTPVQQELRVPLVQQDRQGQLVQQDHQDQMVHPVLMEVLELKVHVEKEGPPAMTLMEMLD